MRNEARAAERIIRDLERDNAITTGEAKVIRSTKNIRRRYRLAEDVQRAARKEKKDKLVAAASLAAESRKQEV